MTSKPTSKRGRPEDPTAQTERKNALMNAATELLRTKSYRSITIREIAELAGTKSAMISYYFGGKEGLFVNILENHATREFGKFKQALSGPDPLKGFIRAAIDNFAHNPEITRLLVDEVVGSKGPLQDRFIDIMPKKMASIMPAIIKKEQEAGLIRADADPKWLAFSLVTMIVAPFLGAPVREQAWKISHDEVSSDAWAEHIYQLFTRGARI